jgi:hypothetical protein
MPSLHALPVAATASRIKPRRLRLRLLKAEVPSLRKAKSLYKSAAHHVDRQAGLPTRLSHLRDQRQCCSTGVPYPTATQRPDVVPLTTDGNYKIPELNHRCPDCSTLEKTALATGSRPSGPRATTALVRALLRRRSFSTGA